MAERPDYYGEKLHQPEDDRIEECYGEPLTIKQGQFIAALITYPTFKKAYNSMEVPYRTARMWVEDEAFDRAYARARAELKEAPKRLIKAALEDAVGVLKEGLKDPNKIIAVKSAELLLNFGLKIIEVEEFEDKIRTIEERVKALPPAPM